MAKIENPTNARHVEHNAGQDSNIARKGTVPKRANDPVAIHPGMTPMQKNSAALGGMGHGTAAINDGGETIASSEAAAPLQHSYGGAPDLKTGKAVAPAFAQRSRINEDCESLDDKMQHGRDCLADAVKN